MRPWLLTSSSRWQARQREGGAAYLSCCASVWCLCGSAARPACDAHWVALTGRTLAITLLGLCSACQVHGRACRVAVLVRGM